MGLHDERWMDDEHEPLEGDERRGRLRLPPFPYEDGSDPELLESYPGYDDGDAWREWVYDGFEGPAEDGRSDF